MSMIPSLRASLPRLPERMRHLPLDHRGFPVPFFVDWLGGKPEFRAFDPRKMARCVNERLCWVCGFKLGVHLGFVLGPMCAVNRVVSEPPSHRDCAIFAATACPFLTQPRMRRNEKSLPAEIGEPAGYHLKRNPGAVCVWMTRRYEVFRVDEGVEGVLFRVGEPHEVLWYVGGKPADGDQVRAAIVEGVEAAGATGIIKTAEDRAAIAAGQEYLRTWMPRPAAEKAAGESAAPG